MISGTPPLLAGTSRVAITLLTLVLFAALFAPVSPAATVTVGPKAEYATIQEGVNVAGNGDEVVVSPGTYLENIQLTGREIVLRSTDPMDRSVVESTIIDGTQSGVIILFKGSETDQSSIAGFTIQNGYGELAGGINADGSTASILRNIITNNRSTKGSGGIYGCAGLIAYNTITYNESGPAGDGGGIGCNVVRPSSVYGNVIMHNEAHGVGGGVNCPVSLANNIIAYNQATDGGGFAGPFRLTYYNNIIYRNVATGRGGGVFHYIEACSGCHGAPWCLNNTIVENTAGESGGGIYGEYGALIENCIVWDNIDAQNLEIAGCDPPIYSCLSPGTAGGEGCLWDNPLLADIDSGNLHLTWPSPCVDAGSQSKASDKDIDGDPRGMDFSQEPRGDGSDNDMGADEFIIIYTLSLSQQGNGTISPNTGSYRFYGGTHVTLTATATGTSYFVGWQGDISGTQSPITIVMDSDKTIQATFENLPYLLYTAVQGKGEVYPPAGQYMYAPGTEVTLTAIPASGWAFASWDGDVAGSPNPVTLTLYEYTTAIATFVKSDQETVECPAGTAAIKTNPSDPWTILVTLTLLWAIARMYGHWMKRRGMK